MQDSFSELSHQDLIGGTGKRTRVLPAFGRVLYHVVLRAFPPLQKVTGDKTAWRDMAASSLGDLRQARLVATGGWPVVFGANVCSLAGIRRFQIFSKIKYFTDKGADKFFAKTLQV